MEVLAAGAAGAGVLSYNRKNFMFDKEQFREKAYFSQEMKIRKHELYREDIRDLTDLTVSKMDVYMVINVLQLLFCVLLFTEGMPQPGLTPLWLHWILAATSGSGVLYFVLSLWLAMHASIAAHSFGVRLLTQFVRLPVPNLQQIDSAAARAKDYEALSLGQILRIPVLQQQLRKLTAAMGDTTQEAEDTTGMEDNFLPEVSAVSVEETASLKHIQLYRELQANWQAYDAYSRVSMAMGTNQLLQSINAYCLGVLLSETKTGWAAACCMAVISCVAWLIVRLDVLVSWKILTGALALQLGTPLLTLICLAAAQEIKGFPKALRWLEWMVPVIFALHFFWLYCCLRLATGHGEKVALPGKFRGVLYLDVFGWLSLEGETPSPQHASRRRPREVQRDDTHAPNQAVPAAVHVAVAGDCLRKKAQLLLQLEKWESSQIDEIRDDAMTAEVARLRQLFRSVEEELQATLQRADDLLPRLQEMAQGDLPRVWLQLEWNSSGHVMEYWYDPDTGESRWSMPAEPDITSHLSKLNEDIETFASQVKALATLITQEQQEQQQVKTNTHFHHQSWVSEASEGNTAQQLLRGSNADAMPDSFFSSTAAAPTTFQPEQTEQQDNQQDDVPHRRRAPGHLPWATFQQGTYALLGIWVCGVLWSIYHILLDPGWVRPDPSGPGFSDLSLHWVRSSKLNLRSMSSSWPHGHFRPQGIACNAKLGSRFFVAERYAVHQLVIPPGNSFFSQGGKEEWHPAVQQCLLEVPNFLASGIRSITTRCEQKECFLVLLDGTGRSLLTCPLGSGNVTHHSELYGGPWQAVASSVHHGSRGSGLWAGRQGRGLVQLGSQLHHAAGLPQEQNASVLVPLVEVEHLAKTGFQSAEHLAVLDDGSVLGLSLNGTLLVHQLDPPSVVEFQLPGEDARWMGLCTPGGRDLFLVGKTCNSEDFAIWRTQLPASF